MHDTQPIRWGVLGAGMIARGITPCIVKAQGCAVAGVAAREPDRARRLLDGLGIDDAMAYTYDELLHDGGVDAVYLTLPNHLHAHWTIRFLEAGKHVLCEKPLCGTAAEARAVAQASEATGKLAAEGFMYTHHPQTHELVRLATAPDSPIGALRRVHAAFCVHQTHEPTIRTRMSHACHGGSVMDLGCYSLSFVHLVAGERAIEVDAVRTSVGDPLEGETAGVDDDMVVGGVFGDVSFTAESSFRDARGAHVTLEGEKGVARTGWPWSPQPDRAEITLTSAQGGAMEPIVITNGGEKFQLQFEAFARAVRGGEPMTPTMAWSVRQAALIERVRTMGGLPVFPSHG